MLTFAALAPMAAGASQSLSPAPAGPFRVCGNRIIDANGKPFLIRGTELPAFPGGDSLAFSAPGAFGPYSPSTFSSIRQRWNMNAIRVPLRISDAAREAEYLAEVRVVVREANALGLLPILSIASPDAPAELAAAFFRRLAGLLKDEPIVMFEVPAGFSRALSDVPQPVIVILPDGQHRRPEETRAANVIYGIPLNWAQFHSDEERDRAFRTLASQAPLLIRGNDLGLDEALPSCAQLPADPSEAESLIEGSLAYFDAHSISWTASVFAPGKLITDYRQQSATTLENGWTCGRPDARRSPGMGQAVQFHQWGGQARGLFAVNGAGGFPLPRGGMAIVYGPILAAEDAHGTGKPLPTRLGRISVRITDRLGISRLAGLAYVSAGWGQANFVVPPGSATGPAQISIVRSDGTVSSAQTTIVDVAPAIWTAWMNGRGPAVAFVINRSAGGPGKTSLTYRCDTPQCVTVPITIPDRGATTVRLLGTGLRYARGTAGMEAKIGGISVPIVGFGATADPGIDSLTVRLTPQLRGLGEADVVLFVEGKPSNIARIRMAGQRAAAAYHWTLPRGFPAPRVPLDNPMSEEKALLGRYLFYDKRLSVNQTTSCATCHRPELAFTDGKRTATGATAQQHPRSAMSLVNVAYAAVFTWSNPTLHSLEEQALVPMFSQHPVELGSGPVMRQFLRILRTDPVYADLVRRAFPEAGNGCSVQHVAKALAVFERTIISAGSPDDRYYFGGDEGAISDSAKRGEVLFYSDPVAGCYRCHGGFAFTDAVQFEGSGPAPPLFHNTGLYNAAGRFSYPAPNVGLYSYTRRLSDVGKFKAPTLRNIAITGPYMHDGSVPTLEAAIDHYDEGGRTIAEGPDAGIGHDNPTKDARVRKLNLSAQNRKDLLAFLESLTDDELLHDPRFANPWPAR